MTEEGIEFWNRARLARDKLAQQYLDHPDVQLIDIGYAEAGEGDLPRIALRIHVGDRWRRAASTERISLPSEIDGIPVVIVESGDYRLET